MLKVERKRFLLFLTRPVWVKYPKTKEFEFTNKGIEDAFLFCCVNENEKPEIIWELDGGQEEWSRWRLFVEYGRMSAIKQIADILESHEYKQTEKGVRAQAEKIAKEMNEEYKRNFSTAVKKAMKGLDSSGIATLL